MHSIIEKSNFGVLFNSQIQNIMKTLDSQITVVKKIISENRYLSDRKKAIFEAGFKTREVAMGSGGCGQVKETKTEVRIQIESGHGRYNFAECVIIQK